MSLSAQKELIRAYCQEAMGQVASAGKSPQQFRGLMPFNSSGVNKAFEQMTSFSSAESAIRELPGFSQQFKDESASHVALQLLYNFLGISGAPVFEDQHFESTWRSLLDELATTEWTYIGVCNLSNFESTDPTLDFGEGISIRERSYEELSAMLGWSEERIERTLGRDWEQGSHGSYVLVIRSTLQKTLDNLALGKDPAFYARLGRLLLALRLVKPGFIRPGRVFFARPQRFRVGYAGTIPSGESRWGPATPYVLSGPELPRVRSVYEELIAVDGLGDSVRSLGLALRSFSMIYEREIFRAEDRLVDAVTAIEATLRLETDLSFRSSFQVAGLLGVDDEDRVNIYREMRIYYDTRSKLVHGGTLKAKHTDALGKHERLIDLVRRLLRAFVHLAARSGIPDDFYTEIDSSLQHTGKRTALRTSMGL